MFTGIITDLGRVRAIGGGDSDRRIEIDTAYNTGAIDPGASICCSGVCLTVTELALRGAKLPARLAVRSSSNSGAAADCAAGLSVAP